MSIPQIPTEMIMQITVAETIAQALKEAQPLAAEYHRALDRALTYLRGGFAYEVRDATLVCQSQTSEATYLTTLTECDCPGYTFHGSCFHPALLTICVSYQTIQAAATAVVAVRRTQPVRQQMRGVRHVEDPLYVPPTPQAAPVRMSKAEYESFVAEIHRDLGFD